MILYAGEEFPQILSEYLSYFNFAVQLAASSIMQTCEKFIGH